MLEKKFSYDRIHRMGLKRLCGQLGKSLEKFRISSKISCKQMACFLHLDTYSYFNLERGDISICLSLIPIPDVTVYSSSRLSNTLYRLSSEDSTLATQAQNVHFWMWCIATNYPYIEKRRIENANS